MGLSLWNLQTAPGVISWEKHQGAIISFYFILFHGAHQHVSKTTILILFVLLPSLSLWSEKGLECEHLMGWCVAHAFSHKLMENQGNWWLNDVVVLRNPSKRSCISCWLESKSAHDFHKANKNTMRRTAVAKETEAYSKLILVIWCSYQPLAEVQGAVHASLSRAKCHALLRFGQGTWRQEGLPSFAPWRGTNLLKEPCKNIVMEWIS